MDSDDRLLKERKETIKQFCDKNQLYQEKKSKDRFSLLLVENHSKDHFRSGRWNRLRFGSKIDYN